MKHNSYGPRVNCERRFSALREDAFGTLASLRLQSLGCTRWFNFFSQIIVVKHDFKSMLHKIVSVKGTISQKSEKNHHLFSFIK